MANGTVPIPEEEINPPVYDPDLPPLEEPVDPDDGPMSTDPVPGKSTSLSEARAVDDLFESRQAVPPGSNQILSRWESKDDLEVVYRVGYYIAPRGFGDSKVQIKHNLNMAAVMATT